MGNRIITKLAEDGKVYVDTETVADSELQKFSHKYLDNFEETEYVMKPQPRFDIYFQPAIGLAIWWRFNEFFQFEVALTLPFIGISVGFGKAINEQRT